MPEESVKSQSATPADDNASRIKSTIDFPYLDLDNAIEIAQAVRDLGGDQCEWHQLAAKLNVTPDGGGFRMRMLTAKTFGLLAYERGNVKLTDLGKAAADPLREKRARYESFMYVGLYKQMFDRLQGQTIPPVAAIERMMENLGVSPKQKEKARQVFQRSAKEAGLLELASDRLTTPPGLNGAPPREQPPVARRETDDSANGGGGGGAPPRHPFIEGLLKTLPPAESKWPTAGRTKWLQAAANIFDLIYEPNDGEDGGEIKITTEKR